MLINQEPVFICLAKRCIYEHLTSAWANYYVKLFKWRLLNPRQQHSDFVNCSVTFCWWKNFCRLFPHRSYSHLGGRKNLRFGLLYESLPPKKAGGKTFSMLKQTRAATKVAAEGRFHRPIQPPTASRPPIKGK